MDPMTNVRARNQEQTKLIADEDDCVQVFVKAKQWRGSFASKTGNLILVKQDTSSISVKYIYIHTYTVPDLDGEALGYSTCEALPILHPHD